MQFQLFHIGVGGDGVVGCVVGGGGNGGGCGGGPRGEEEVWTVVTNRCV